MVLMMEEFEILCWINYVDQVNLLNLSFNVNDPVSVIYQAKQTLWHLAFSAKTLLNKEKVKLLNLLRCRQLIEQQIVSEVRNM